MSGQRRSIAIEREAGADLYAQLRQGHGVHACYDAAAAPLYQYCWALVGPGHIRERRHGDPELSGASAAITDTFLTATSEIRRLGDPGDFPAWLFALARAACQRQGFATTSPYAELATVPNERPIIQALILLPPSQRELLELALRHGLTPAQRGRVVGLDAEMAGELTHTTVRRAADLLRAPDAARIPDATDIGELMASVPPPRPPQELRGLVLAACADPDRTAAWSARAQALFPLGTDGFPLHRDGGPAPAPVDEPPIAPPTAEDAPRADLHTERLSTDDVPAQARAEQLAEIDPEVDSGGSEPRRGKWFVPAVAGVLTILAAASIWGAATVLTDAPPAGIEAGEAAGPDLSPSPSESPATAAPSLEDAPDADPTANSTGPTDESRGAHSHDTLSDAPDDEDATGNGSQAGDGANPAPESSPEAPPSEDDPERGAHQDGHDPSTPEEDDSGGLLTDLWDGIRDIIGGNRQEPIEEPSSSD